MDLIIQSISTNLFTKTQGWTTNYTNEHHIEPKNHPIEIRKIIWTKPKNFGFHVNLPGCNQNHHNTSTNLTYNIDPWTDVICTKSHWGRRSKWRPDCVVFFFEKNRRTYQMRVCGKLRPILGGSPHIAGWKIHQNLTVFTNIIDLMVICL